MVRREYNHQGTYTFFGLKPTPPNKEGKHICPLRPLLLQISRMELSAGLDFC